MAFKYIFKTPLARVFLIPVLLASLLLITTAQPAQAQGLNLIRDQEIEDTLRELSRPVFEQAGISLSSVRFILVQDNALNAFVAGGQNIFVHTGLILETSNPEELVGVIAHETGHIASGHLLRTHEAMDDLKMQSMLTSILGIAAAIGTGNGGVGMAAVTASQTLAVRGFLRHSRVQESSADQSAVRFLQDAHLPLSGLVSFMGKLSNQELLPESQQSEYVRTHPLTRDRINFLKNADDTQRRKGTVPADWVEKHIRMKAKLYGYLYPERAVNDTGTTIAARYGRAIALYRRGKIADALAETDKLLKIEPDNAWFHELKGQILFETGKVSDAIPPYARAVALAPRAGLLYAAYGHALLESAGNDKTRLTEAVAALKRSQRTEPYQARTHRLLATAYGKLGEEGLSHLHLAEEAGIRGDFSAARREVVLAQQKLPKNSPGWLRAEDIQDQITKKDKKKN